MANYQIILVGSQKLFNIIKKEDMNEQNKKYFGKGNELIQ